MTRAATEIGAGLDPARAARPIRTGERIHIVGAAGAGASAAALLAQHAGARVTGCDPGGPSPYTDAVAAAGLPLAWEHSPRHVTDSPRPDRLAVTKALTAVDPTNPELEAARALGTPLGPWQQVIADAAVGRTLIAVAGTHGKSTTAGWLVHVLTTAGRDPSAFVGALLPASITGGRPATARLGQGAEFVVEGDEYAGNFDPYRPALAVITNVEWDHPDVFRDQAAVIDTFEGWLRRATGSVAAPTAVVNVGDGGAADVAARLRDWPGRIIRVAVADDPAGGAGRADGPAGAGPAADLTAGAGPAADLTARTLTADADGTTIEISGRQLEQPLRVRLATAGRHNVANALAVAAASLHLGVAPQALASGLASFAGVGRRLERLGEARGVVVYDDYGHHPTAIRATLAAMRQREPARRIWAVYEPLTYHRTAAMLPAFADALAAADAVVIAAIWASRDPDTTVASSEGLARAVAARRPHIPVAAPGTVEETAAWLAGEVRPGDAVLVMGGGRSYEIGRLLLEALRR